MRGWVERMWMEKVWIGVRERVFMKCTKDVWIGCKQQSIHRADGRWQRTDSSRTHLIISHELFQL